MTFQNATSIFTNLAGLLKSKAGLEFIVEHSCSPTQATTVKAALGKISRKALLSDLEPVMGHQKGGTAVIAGAGCRAYRINPSTPHGLQLSRTGRFDIFGSDMANNLTFYFFVLYGWSGGNDDPLLRLRTDGLVRAVRDEILAPPERPLRIIATP